jgi:hypothetical protein
MSAMHGGQIARTSKTNSEALLDAGVQEFPPVFFAETEVHGELQRRIQLQKEVELYDWFPQQRIYELVISRPPLELCTSSHWPAED